MIVTASKILHFVSALVSWPFSVMGDVDCWDFLFVYHNFLLCYLLCLIFTTSTNNTPLLLLDLLCQVHVIMLRNFIIHNMYNLLFKYYPVCRKCNILSSLIRSFGPTIVQKQGCIALHQLRCKVFEKNELIFSDL